MGKRDYSKVDFYGLKEDAYGTWQDAIYLNKQGNKNYTKLYVTACEALYRCLENTTGVSTSDFGETFEDELYDLTPATRKRVNRILNDLLGGE